MHFLSRILCPLSLALAFCACSRLYVQHDFEQLNSTNWRALSAQEDVLYSYEYRSDSVCLRLEKLDRVSWGLVGVPLIPFIPLSLFRPFSSDTLHYYVEASGLDTTREFYPPLIALSTDSSNVWLQPHDVIIWPKGMTRNSWTGQRRVPDGARTCEYKFFISPHPEHCIEVAFLRPYFGCNIPSMIYVLTSHTHYDPLLLPEAH